MTNPTPDPLKEKIEEIIFPLLPYKRPEYRNERDRVARRILELLAEEREQAHKEGSDEGFNDGVKKGWSYTEKDKREAQREILEELKSWAGHHRDDVPTISLRAIEQKLEWLNSENEG